MNKTIKTIATITVMGIMLSCAYLSGTAHAEPVTEIGKTEKAFEAMPDEYTDASSEESITDYIDIRKVTFFVKSDDGIQLYFEDGTGYWLEGKKDAQ